MTRTIVSLAIVLAVCGGTRWFYGSASDSPGFRIGQLMENAGGVKLELNDLPFRFFVAPNLGIFFLYGAFWIIAFKGYAAQPLFMRRAALVVPIFCIFHLLLTRLCAYRPYLVLGPILIPMGLWYLWGTRHTDE